jgi:hypothetical protein
MNNFYFNGEIMTTLNIIESIGYLNFYKSLIYGCVNKYINDNSDELYNNFLKLDNPNIYQLGDLLFNNDLLLDESLLAIFPTFNKYTIYGFLISHQYDKKLDNLIKENEEQYLNSNNNKKNKILSFFKKIYLDSIVLVSEEIFIKLLKILKLKNINLDNLDDNKFYEIDKLIDIKIREFKNEIGSFNDFIKDSIKLYKDEIDINDK